MRILSLSVDEIQALVKDFEKDQIALKKECINLSWFMRGGLSLSEAYTMSFEEREIVGEMVKEHLETTKKSGLPYF
jgi:hypothetical protein